MIDRTLKKNRPSSIRLSVHTRKDIKRPLNQTQISACWYDTVRACGVTENDAEAIRLAFFYDGFNLPLAA